MRTILMAALALSCLMFEPIAGVSNADARVGRPLTPLSYAGVARRHYRRGVYGGYYGAPYRYGHCPYGQCY